MNKQLSIKWKLFRVFNICMYISIIIFLVASIVCLIDIQVLQIIEVPFVLGIVFVLITGTCLSGMTVLFFNYLGQAIKERNLKVLKELLFKFIFFVLVLMFIELYNHEVISGLWKVCSNALGLAIFGEEIKCYWRMRKEYKKDGKLLEKN